MELVGTEPMAIVFMSQQEQEEEQAVTGTSRVSCGYTARITQHN
jgi:hypothetical protein